MRQYVKRLLYQKMAPFSVCHSIKPIVEIEINFTDNCNKSGIGAF